MKIILIGKVQPKRFDYATRPCMAVTLRRRGVVKVSRRPEDLSGLADVTGATNPAFASSLKKFDNLCFDMMRLIHAILTFDGENVKALTPQLTELVKNHKIFRLIKGSRISSVHNIRWICHSLELYVAAWTRGVPLQAFSFGMWYGTVHALKVHDFLTCHKSMFCVDSKFGPLIFPTPPMLKGIFVNPKTKLLKEFLQNLTAHEKEIDLVNEKETLVKKTWSTQYRL